MNPRIIFDKNGVKVSRIGFNAATTSNKNLLMHPNMTPMLPVFHGSATFTGNGTQSFSFSNPYPDSLISIIMRSSDGRLAHPESTFYATTQAPFTSIKIHNIDGMSRTIEFRVLS